MTKATTTGALRGTLTRSEAFHALDLMDVARTNMDGTLTMLFLVLEGSEREEDRETALQTLVRHIESDRKAMATAYGQARKIILEPVYDGEQVEGAEPEHRGSAEHESPPTAGAAQ